MKVKDLLTMDIDIDVYDDVCEELAICFVGPMKLTPAGHKKFAEVLNYDVTLHNNGAYTVAIVGVDSPDDRTWKRRLKKARTLFEGAAGYCTVDEYKTWFED